MPKLDDFFDEIDAARVRRAKELSEVKRSFGRLAGNDVYGVASKAVVVLAYANWEGVYNECVRAYLKFLVEKGGRVRDQDWMLLVSAFHADFESMRDRNHSLDSRQAFVKNLQARIDCGFDSVDGKIVEARSNLDFARLSENYGLLRSIHNAKGPKSTRQGTGRLAACGRSWRLSRPHNYGCGGSHQFHVFATHTNCRPIPVRNAGKDLAGIPKSSTLLLSRLSSLDIQQPIAEVVVAPLGAEIPGSRGERLLDVVGRAVGRGMDQVGDCAGDDRGGK